MDRAALDAFAVIALASTMTIFVVGAMLTPPDPYTQMVVAVPGIVFSLLLAWFLAVQLGVRLPGASE